MRCPYCTGTGVAVYYSANRPYPSIGPCPHCIGGTSSCCEVTDPTCDGLTASNEREEDGR